MHVRARRPSAQIATAVCAVLRAVPICAPLAFIGAPAAVAQAPEGGALAAAIPAQPLAQALSAFASQTGLQLVYVSEIVQNKKSRKAAAGLSAQQGLAQILRGTGLKFEYLTPHSIRILAADPSPRSAGTSPSNEDLSEVIVTASRRDEHLLNVPMTIEVLTGETLAKINATTFDDYANYLPNVTAHGIGPNQNSIYLRGLGTGQVGVQGYGFGGAFPSVAVYLDEQSVQLPSRNLDIYTADLARIEVLEGPQGTLFGAGAEAGVLRYITNKPQLDVTEGSVSAGYAQTADGAPSTALSAVFNLPILENRLAARAVVYDERRGGYIDNVPATFVRSNSDASIAYAGDTVPANSVVLKNTGLVGNNINPVTYSGVRAEILYQIDESWSALIAQSYQRIDADGVFAEEAVNSLGQRQPDLTVQLYNPSYDRDWFENSALTLEGSIGPLKLLYAGAYLVRNVEQVEDYTNYVRGGGYVDYYQCIPGPKPAARCFSPSATWHDQERNTHQSHELRLSTPDDWRVRAVGGLFLENYAIYDQTDFFYLTATPYFYPLAPPTGYWAVNGSPVLPSGQVACFCNGGVVVPGAPTLNNPNVRPPGDAFFEDITRGYKQKALYTSIDFDLIPQTLTLTGGTRYSSTESWEVGAYAGSFGCQLIFSPDPPNPCRNRDFTNVNALGLDRTYAGFKSRASISWKVSPEAVVYYTWSQGFRPGFFNRGFETPGNSPLNAPLPPGAPAANQATAAAHGGWQPPLAVTPDSLTNNELGWKTNWLDERIQWNGALYQENWDHVQLDSTDASVIGASAINGGDYRVRGLETSGKARVTDGLTLEFGAAWNHSELIKQATFYWLDGTPIDFNALKIPNPAGALGSPLAGAPAFRGNARARYERSFDGYDAFVQLGAAYQSGSLSSNDQLTLDPQGNPRSYALPAYTTFDAALGVGKDAWLVQLYGENLSDTRAELYTNYNQYYQSVTVNRPRTVGLRFSYRIRRSQAPFG
jgi:outer membrane receptor protein involved in Fe transport